MRELIMMEWERVRAKRVPRQEIDSVREREAGKRAKRAKEMMPK